MKIGIYSTMGAVPWGASEVLWHGVARRIMDAGGDIAINYKHWSPTPPQLIELTDRGATLWTRQRGNKVFGNLKRSLRMGDVHGSWLDRTRPDHVLISAACSQCDVIVGRDCQRRGIPYSIVVHGADPHVTQRPHKAKEKREIYADAQRIYSVSPTTTELLQQQLHAEFNHVVVVCNPISDACSTALAWPEPRPQRRKLTPPDVLQLACVGRFDTSSKGQDLLLQALADPKWRSRNLQVNFWGDDNRDLEHLQQMAVDLGVAGQVKFCGFERNLRRLWGAHHALVLPSRHEGVPLATVEAMMCGRPPIVTAVGRNAEFVDHLETGFLAAEASVSAIAHALDVAWQQRDLWKAMGAEAARRIRLRYAADPLGQFHAWLLEDACMNGCASNGKSNSYAAFGRVPVRALGLADRPK